MALLRGKPHEKASGSPVSEIKMEIETTFGQSRRTAFEVSLFIRTDEALGRYPRPRGERSQLLSLQVCQRTVDSLELVILIFAYGHFFQGRSRRSQHQSG